jgi:hypothetical protein
MLLGEPREWREGDKEAPFELELGASPCAGFQERSDIDL